MDGLTSYALGRVAFRCPLAQCQKVVLLTASLALNSDPFSNEIAMDLLGITRPLWWSIDTRDVMRCGASGPGYGSGPLTRRGLHLPRCSFEAAITPKGSERPSGGNPEGLETTTRNLRQSGRVGGGIALATCAYFKQEMYRFD